MMQVLDIVVICAVLSTTLVEAGSAPVEAESDYDKVVKIVSDHTIVINNETVQWGYFSKNVPPVKKVSSGSIVTVEMATHHACDDWDKMIKGDSGMESVFTSTPEVKNETERGATGSIDGAHILTGPIYVKEAMPGDILKVEILDLYPRKNPDGKAFGSNAAAWWGFQARVNKVDGGSFKSGSFSETPSQNDEYITIYEVIESDDGDYVTPSYQFEWPNITDPNGIHRDFIAYPATCVPHDAHGDTVPSDRVSARGWTKKDNITYYDEPYPVKIPVNYHVGCMGLPPASHDFVDSIPPMPTGGNLDNKRIGIGTTMYYPVEVAGGLLSMGDAHVAQGDSELGGTGIDISITGDFKLTLIRKADFVLWQEQLDFPLGETASEYIVHGFTETDYLETFSKDPSDIYGASSIDKAMKNAYAQTKKFMIARWDLTEMEATTIITQAVDFGVTQLANGNLGVHGTIPKNIFPDWGETSDAEKGYGEKSEESKKGGRGLLAYFFMTFVGLIIIVGFAYIFVVLVK
mmetsp:Transcript_57934/g.67600  ORF Transcript_57934/g.67600 Transcript_57934/m.67600 type:complete len:519 (-) Transcript_57934:87-1643(-)